MEISTVRKAIRGEMLALALGQLFVAAASHLGYTLMVTAL